MYKKTIAKKTGRRSLSRASAIGTTKVLNNSATVPENESKQIACQKNRFFRNFLGIFTRDPCARLRFIALGATHRSQEWERKNGRPEDRAF